MMTIPDGQAAATSPRPSERADEWATHVRDKRDEYKVGTQAHHLLGDISRDVEDFLRVDPGLTDDVNYYGAWLTGFGFVNVKFPRSTTRDLTDAEVEWLAEHPVVMS